MRKRMVSGALILGTALCLLNWGHLMSWGEDQKQSKPVAAKGPAAKQQPASPPKTVPHATLIEDLASERTIRAQSAAFIAEFNAKNATALVARFQPTAEYELETGEVIVGRAAIQKHFEKVFAQYPAAKARILESRLRTVSLNSAIEEGNLTTIQSEEDSEEKNHYIAVWTFVDGSWSLKSYRELEGAEHSQTAHEQLVQLEWMVGEWVHEAPDALVKTSCRWSADGNFLLQDFRVNIEGVVVAAGSQRIGWDPLTKKLHSWVFDSEGGFGEATWNWDGTQWVIRSSAVKHDGETTSSLSFLTPLSGDSYRWESSHRMAGDNNLPDLDLVIARQAPPPQSPPATGAVSH